MIILRSFFRLCLVFIFILLPAYLSAAIVVSNFHSDIIVKVNRSFEVRETILINVEGSIDPEVLYRNIPVQLMTPQGVRTRVNLMVNRVLVDGRSESFSVRNNRRYKKVRIKEPGKILQHGMHTIVFEYVIANQVRFFDKYDEISWNITGSNDNLTFQNASAKIIFPSGIEIISSSGFTGYNSGNICDCTGGPVQKSIWEGYITEPLYPAMGWGVTIRFTGGYILPVSPENVSAMIWKRNRIFYTGLGGIIIVIILYAGGWLLSGRNEKGKHILPKSVPPSGYSADLCRYLYYNGYDSGTFTALMLQMAVKGAVTFYKNKEIFILKKPQILPANLSKTESGVLARIFKSKNTLELDPRDSGTIRDAYRYHEKVLMRRRNYFQFRNNLSWILPGLIFSFVPVVLMNSWIFIYNPETYDFTMAIGFFTLAVIPLFTYRINNHFFSSDSYKFTILLISAISLFFLETTISSNVVFTMKDTDLDWNIIPFYTVIVISLFMMGMIVSFVVKMRSGIGAKFANELEGLRQYLRTLDYEKLALINRPAMTVRHFENLLPYAAGLDVEDFWSFKFEPLMNRSIRSGYPVTTWYNGNIHDFSASRFSNEIRYSLQSVLLACYFPDRTKTLK